MIVLGVDPGSRCAGWAAVEARGSRLLHRGHGVIRLNPQQPLEARLEVLFDRMEAICREVRPERVVVESLFQHKNARSALVLGHARGVVLLAASRTGSTLRQLSPAEIKKAVTGRGRADKHQVQQMVVSMLGLREVPPTDAADALAIAVAGTVQHRFAELVAEAGGGR